MRGLVLLLQYWLACLGEGVMTANFKIIKDFTATCKNCMILLEGILVIFGDKDLFQGGIM